MWGWCGLETPPQSDFGLLLVKIVTLKFHVALENSRRACAWKWVGYSVHLQGDASPNIGSPSQRASPAPRAEPSSRQMPGKYLLNGVAE